MRNVLQMMGLWTARPMRDGMFGMCSHGVEGRGWRFLDDSI